MFPGWARSGAVKIARFMRDGLMEPVRDGSRHGSNGGIDLRKKQEKFW
jgi:hypothetical protein